MKSSYSRGQKDTRPWGTWEVLDCGKNFCVKRIVVTPGGILSLQMHHYRSEHWIVVGGKAVITLGERELEKSAGEAVFIPVTVKHRIRNEGTENLEFIEVQCGENLDENDIVRFEDVYGRVK